MAQDLTTYGRDLPDGRRTTAPTWSGCWRPWPRCEGVRWIRLHYAYPDRGHRRAAGRHGARAAVAKYLDVPIQHVDSDVLKSMRRGYGERAGARPGRAGARARARA